jgi:hypothetical protein
VGLPADLLNRDGTTRQLSTDEIDKTEEGQFQRRMHGRPAPSWLKPLGSDPTAHGQ